MTSQTGKQIITVHILSNITKSKGNQTMTFGQLIEHRSSHPDEFLRKGVLKICNKFTGEHPCRSAISIKLQSNFTEIILQHGCSPVNLLHIFRTLFPWSTSGWLLMRNIFLEK